MSRKIKVIQCGLGNTGVPMAECVLAKRDLELVAVVRRSKRWIGKDLGLQIGLNRELGITVSGNPSEVIRAVKADVVLMSMVDEPELFLSTVRAALETKKNVIDVGLLGYNPWRDAPELGREVDELAKKNGVSFLATGMTPGILMDYIPITLTSMMKRVDKITIRGMANWTNLALSSYESYGFGQSIDVFNKRAAKGEIVGFSNFRRLMDSTAKTLGWEIEEFKQTIRGLVAKSRKVGKAAVVELGMVCGFENIARGFWKGKEVITYQRGGIVQPLPEDNVEMGLFYSIEGETSVEVTLKGDVVLRDVMAPTAAEAVNSIPQVIAARPGLIDPLDLSPSPCLPSLQS